MARSQTTADPACAGKRRYASKKAARRALSHCHGTFADMRCYQCRCGGWHLAHRDQRGLW